MSAPVAAVLPAQVSPPQFALSALLPHALQGVEELAFPVLTDELGELLLGPGAEEASQTCGVDLLEVVDRADPGQGRTPATPGEVLSVPVTGADGVRRVHLVGVGGQRPEDLRRAGAALARVVRDRTSLATTVADVGDDEALAAFVVGMMLGSFGFHWRAAGPPWRPVERVVLAGLPLEVGLEHVVERALAVGGAGWRSRVLATVPSNLKDPAWLADQAEQVAAESGLRCTVWDERELARRGMGGLLAVGRASASPPRLIRLDYSPPNPGRRTPRVVLVGKGITFDSGGLSIKPAASMTTMKRDMTGGGVVIAVLAALAGVGCPVHVTGLVAAAENAVGGDAVRPGDVIAHYGGRTSEVTNTDAEGRLVLADVLAYAADELDPAVMVDVATLTGAMKVALGQGLGGVFANSDALAERLLAAGRRSGEPLWRMPLVADYEEKLASKVADADNAPGGAGAITAALFLQHFVAGLPWAHLDVASVGDAPRDRHEWTEGPTGFGARVLLEWLGSPDPVRGL